MDFGLGKFLEMFREYFGEKWTKLLVGLIAVTVIVVCVGLILAGLKATVDFFTETPPDSTFFELLFYRILPILAAFGVIVFFARKNVFKLLNEAKSLEIQARKISDEVRQEVKTIQEDTNKEFDGFEKSLKKIEAKAKKEKHELMEEIKRLKKEKNVTR